MELRQNFLPYYANQSVCVYTEDDVSISYPVHHLVGRLVSKSVIRGKNNFSDRILDKVPCAPLLKSSQTEPYQSNTTISFAGYFHASYKRQP